MCVCAFAARAHQHAPPLRLPRVLPVLRVSWHAFACVLNARVHPSPTRARVRALAPACARPRCVRLLPIVNL
eukprot:4747809-Pleurochrysis_carterae.AAC.1